jgi:hypothetical protein
MIQKTGALKISNAVRHPFPGTDKKTDSLLGLLVEVFALIESTPETESQEPRGNYDIWQEHTL